MEKRTRIAAVLAVFLVLLSLAPAAQRGGGRRGGFERPETPMEFDGAELGFKLNVPENLQLYTMQAPGRYRSVLQNGRFLYIANPQTRRASMVAKVSAGMTEADLDGYRGILETSPPQARLDGFRKHSVRMIKIGRHADKDALDFVYDVREKDVPLRIRQVVFVHNGKGFTFTCTSIEAEYGVVDGSMFGAVLSRLEFR